MRFPRDRRSWTIEKTRFDNFDSEVHTGLYTKKKRRRRDDEERQRSTRLRFPIPLFGLARAFDRWQSDDQHADREPSDTDETPLDEPSEADPEFNDSTIDEGFEENSVDGGEEGILELLSELPAAFEEDEE